MNKQQLEAKLKALREECTLYGFELLGAILDPEESAITDTLLSHDDLYCQASDTMGYALEELGLDDKEYEVVYFAVKAE